MMIFMTNDTDDQYSMSNEVTKQYEQLIKLLREQGKNKEAIGAVLSQAMQVGVDKMLLRYGPKEPSRGELNKNYLMEPQVGDRWVWCGDVPHDDIVVIKVDSPSNIIAHVSPAFSGKAGLYLVDQDWIAWQVHIQPNDSQTGPADFETMSLDGFTHNCVREQSLGRLSDLTSCEIESSEILGDLRLNKEKQ